MISDAENTNTPDTPGTAIHAASQATPFQATPGRVSANMTVPNWSCLVLVLGRHHMVQVLGNDFPFVYVVFDSECLLRSKQNHLYLYNCLHSPLR